MTQFILWYCLSLESQNILRKLMPSGWSPPAEFIKYINLDTEIEDTEEISHLIREKPKSKRESSW